MTLSYGYRLIGHFIRLLIYKPQSAGVLHCITTGNGTTLLLSDLLRVYSSSHGKNLRQVLCLHITQAAQSHLFALYPEMITDRFAVSDLNTEGSVVHEERLRISWLS